MKILWNNHPTDKTKNGTTEHVAQEFATVACGYGQASICPIPRRGTNEYLQMRAEEEANRKPGIYDVVPPVTNTISSGWTAIKLKLWGGVVVVKKVGREELRFKVPPVDCPPNIVALYNELKGINDGANREEIERVKREQAANNAAPQKLW